MNSAEFLRQSRLNGEEHRFCANMEDLTGCRIAQHKQRMLETRAVDRAELQREFRLAAGLEVHA